jgi:hypothetical protein
VYVLLSQRRGRHTGKVAGGPENEGSASRMGQSTAASLTLEDIGAYTGQPTRAEYS